LQLAFESQSLRAICENENQAKLELGAAAATMLKHRLADLRAASSVRDIVAGRPREIDGPPPKPMVVDLCDGRRIVFTANHPNNLTGPTFCTTASERVYITISSGKDALGGSQGAVGDRRAATCGANAAGAGGL